MEKKKLLIVDDEKYIREVLSHSFEKKGFTTDTATDGKEALEKIALDKPDVVILDVSMPLMDGLEVCRRLKGDPDTQDIPIIVLSSEKHSPSEIKNNCGKPIFFIQKPCELEYLLICINNILL